MLPPRIVRINGGLGNQLFQYCFGKKLEKESKKPVYFDITELDLSGGLRNFELKYFKFYEGDKYKFVRYKATKSPYNFYYRLYPKTGFAYDDLVTTTKAGIYTGYYQDLKYLDYLEDNQPSFQVDPKYIYQTDIDYGEKSLALHIRGTDYLKSANHPPLNKIYYEKAINYFCESYDINSIYILTDDPDYASSLIPNQYSPKIISSGSSIGDFSVLTSFKNIVIANSTYSLWAAYIGKQNKNVVGPLNWTVAHKQESLLPINWIKF